jgi:hypothetical protein
VFASGDDHRLASCHIVTSDLVAHSPGPTDHNHSSLWHEQ